MNLFDIINQTTIRVKHGRENMEDVLRFSSEATQNASNTSTIVYIIAVINICFFLVVIFGILEIAINTRKTRKTRAKTFFI